MESKQQVAVTWVLVDFLKQFTCCRFLYRQTVVSIVTICVTAVSGPTEIVSALQHLCDVDLGGPLGDLHYLMIADFG